jgi:hypothetical protein
MGQPMSDVILALDSMALELASILGNRGQNNAEFVSDLQRLFEAHLELFVVDEPTPLSPTRKQVINYLQASIQAMQTATRIVHLGFNQPHDITKNLKRGVRQLKTLEELFDLYYLAEQATRPSDQKPRFYDERAAEAALSEVFNNIVEELDTRERQGMGHLGGGSLAETFYGAPRDEAGWTFEAVEFDKELPFSSGKPGLRNFPWNSTGVV